jgi:RibD domain-containing protein
MRDLIVTSALSRRLRAGFPPPAARRICRTFGRRFEHGAGPQMPCSSGGHGRADARLLAAADKRHDGHHHYLNDVSKYVVSSTLQDPGWERTTVPRNVDETRALKSETGGDIVTTGSIRLVRELIAAGLVDEYRLFAYPVVLGRGQRLFADATEVSRCVWWRASPSAPASCFCAIGQPDATRHAPVGMVPNISVRRGMS